jgi:2-polyprenyl-3-methyl-5-hydroxy-6-metoxy-1,4-benzoquinol methylase
VFVELADSGSISGRVLDARCGTGEHVVMLAGRGLEVTGIDAAPIAIALAQGKARP